MPIRPRAAGGAPAAPRTRPLTRWLAAAAALAGCLTPTSAQTRIACLGDSITFGARIDDLPHHCYPSQLAALRPDDDVRGFGVGGATLLLLGDRPYVATEAFARALAFRPDVAVVVLGTNDTCGGARRNWEHRADLTSNARTLVARLLTANPAMRVVLASPPAMFAEQDGLADARRADLRTRARRVDAVAAALQRACAEHPRADYLELRSTLRGRDVVDGVHPNPFGAERIARRIDEFLRSRAHDAMPPLAGLQQFFADAHLPAEAETFHGFPGAAFALPRTGARCRVFAPHTVAAGAPWVLRARFFGHQPALDLALLERGFHLAYCDVKDLYGNDEAMRRWDELYALLTAHGGAFAPRVVLEGMSRGGLPIVNWAARHPDRVAAIYGDNPVADFRSWPGGKNGKRSDRDWQRCLAAYGLDDAAAHTYDRMPIDRLAPIAAAKVPLLLVLGRDDDVVPPAENGDVLAERYRALGGPVQVWRKPGQGHHPHGLDPVAPLLRAVLAATGSAPDVTTRAVPAVEYRRGAGWGDDGWHGQVAKMRALAKAHPDTRLVFLGDSITQGLTGANDRRARADGTRAIDRAFGAHGALSLGMSGDRTEHVLWRIEHGALAELAPDVIVLQIGVNNLNAAGHTATETAAGVRAMLALLAEREPQATVLVCGPFPAGERHSLVRAAVDELHQHLPALAAEAGPRVVYRDLRPLFVDDDGACNDRMRPDRLHIGRSGQDAWMAALREQVEALLAR